MGDNTWGDWDTPTSKMKGLNTDLIRHRLKTGHRCCHVPDQSVPFTPYLDGSGVAVRKWTQGFVGSWGRTETILAVVRKPPESMQMPLSLSLRMFIITSAVMLPAEDGVGRAQQTGV